MSGNLLFQSFCKMQLQKYLISSRQKSNIAFNLSSRFPSFDYQINDGHSDSRRTKNLIFRCNHRTVNGSVFHMFGPLKINRTPYKCFTIDTRIT